MRAIYSSVAGCVWKITTKAGNRLNSGDTLLILESMKMEIEVLSDFSGTLHKVLVEPGQQIQPGQMIALLQDS